MKVAAAAGVKVAANAAGWSGGPNGNYRKYVDSDMCKALEKKTRNLVDARVKFTGLMLSPELSYVPARLHSSRTSPCLNHKSHHRVVACSHPHLLEKQLRGRRISANLAARRVTPLTARMAFTAQDGIQNALFLPVLGCQAQGFSQHREIGCLRPRVDGEGKSLTLCTALYSNSNLK